jgi:CDP-4-dehydro-6-deoxyglucose reductase
VAGGTGFAPIKACLEHMASSRQSQPQDRTIHFYWGARSLADLYDIAGLGALSERLPGLRFVPVLDRGHPDRSARTGLVHRAIIDDFDDLSDYDIYACGAPAMIEALSSACAAERGFDPSRLTADLFVAGPAGAAITPPPGPPVGIVLNDADGPQAIRGVEGEALLFALKRARVDLPAICGGKGACGTCCIHVAPQWRSRLPEPGKREARLLQFIGAEKGDRLSCQILLAAHLDGLELQPVLTTKETHNDHDRVGDISPGKGGGSLLHGPDVQGARPDARRHP